MKRIPTSLIGHEHAYTRSKCPWILSVGNSAYARMINYISGGGMRTFGRTVRQEEILVKRIRFLSGAAALAAVWLVLWAF